jgi:hypothetical protein
MSYPRRWCTDIAVGFRAAMDVLLWGQAYPRTDPNLTARLLASLRAGKR